MITNFKMLNEEVVADIFNLDSNKLSIQFYREYLVKFDLEQLDILLKNRL